MVTAVLKLRGKVYQGVVELGMDHDLCILGGVEVKQVLGGGRLLVEVHLLAFDPQPRGCVGDNMEPLRGGGIVPS